MTRHTIYSIIATLCALCGITGCADDLDFRPTEITEGETEVKFELSFKDFTPALASRSAGNSIESINNLWMVIYNTDDERSLFASINVTDKIKTEASETLPDTKKVSFTMKMLNGTYRIYAVANMDLSGQDVTTEAKLKSLRPKWDTANVSNNAQMFGWFANGTNTVSLKDGSGNINHQLFDAAPVEISPSNKTLHALLFRLASKVTVAFDGSGLEDGISIYIKSLRIRNIPASCALGQFNEIGKSDDNTATESEDKTPVKSDDLIDTGEEIQYALGKPFDKDYPALITKQNPFFPRKTATDADSNPTWDEDSNPHSAKSPNSLFFYENMQGVAQITEHDQGLNKQPIDNNNDGILDVKYQHSKMPNATYIEVDAYYYSSNPDNPGICNITYRFMLGQNVTDDYNALRNCHYKLTLGFKGYADNPDWRIDYVTRLWVTEPHVVDYRGKYFVPDQVISNQGNDFSDDNEIIVNSFMYDKDSWDKTGAVPFEVEYRDAGDTEFSSDRPDWLNDFDITHETEVVDGKTVNTGVHRYKINYKNLYTSQNINDDLKNNPAKPDVYDLSTNGGDTPMNTANCYIVDAPGTYSFPLVYGNAMTNGEPNDKSYKYQNISYNPENNTQCLETFLNYLGKMIKSPYIADDISSGAAPNNWKVSLVWQDANNLITPSNIKYVAGDYSNKGGIRFTISKDDIKEGNAVIALKDASGTIMWSWHIWVTAIDFSREIILTNHATYGSRNFKIMPVNLGWCSGGTHIRYYDRHECEVRFTQQIGEGQDGVSQTVKIIQEPHIAVPCGNNPYYQWGRKDPFIAGGNANNTTKTWYDSTGATQSTAPAMMYMGADNTRVPTYQATAALIKNPDKWQNGPRKANGAYNEITNPYVQPFFPDDIIYLNLWDNSCWDGNDDVVKTIYDPCPADWHVSSIYTFSGFTDTGSSIGQNWGQVDLSKNMYAATEENMMPDKFVDGKPDTEYTKYRERIFEFYTNKTKLISLGFPTNGYRDWDDKAKLLKYDEKEGQLWHAQAIPFEWSAPYYAYHFEYNRTIPHIWPWNNFYATDGFPVRPTRTL